MPSTDNRESLSGVLWRNCQLLATVKEYDPILDVQEGVWSPVAASGDFTLDLREDWNRKVATSTWLTPSRPPSNRTR